MNEAKAIEYLSETFRFDKYEGSDGNYELISNYWGMKFNVRIREFTIFLADTSGGAKCSIDADEDETTIARELTAFIGEVLKDESSHYVYDGTNGILAWPYNCNFAYIKYIKQCFDMNPDESDYEYMGRKLGKNLDNSRKPIKSDYHLEPGEMKAYQITNYDVHYGRKDDYFLYNIKGEYSPDRPDELIDLIKNQLKYHKKIYRLEFGTGEVFDVEYDENMEPRLIPANKINSSMQGQERGIQAIMDEYGCSREEAIDIMNSEVTSGCHGKAKKNKKEPSDTEIESSTERNANNLNKIFG